MDSFIHSLISGLFFRWQVVYGILKRHQEAQRVSLLHAFRWLHSGGQALFSNLLVSSALSFSSSSSSSSLSAMKGNNTNTNKKGGKGSSKSGGAGKSANKNNALRGLGKVLEAVDTLKLRLEELGLPAFVRRCVDMHPWVKQRMHRLDKQRKQVNACVPSLLSIYLSIHVVQQYTCTTDME